MLPPIIGMLLPFLTNGDLTEFLAGLGNDQLKSLVKARFAAVAPAVVADLEADGWDYHAKTTARPDPPAAYVAGIMFRALKEGGMPGGKARDVLRDKHAKAVLAAVAGRITPETPPAEAVKLVGEAFAESLF